MNRKTALILIIFLFAVPLFSQNNDFFLESMRLSGLAVENYQQGDYDAAYGYAEEAIQYARLSDKLNADRLIVEAKRLLDWVDQNDIASMHPNNYNLGKSHYDNAVIAHSNEVWVESIDFSVKAIEIFVVLRALFQGSIAQPITVPERPAITIPTIDEERPVITIPSITDDGRPVITTPTITEDERPASTTPTVIEEERPASTTPTVTEEERPITLRQYTVRTWAVEKDCLWNIAAYPWIYGDPWRWVDLYEANKSKMPDPDNPDWIEPGMVLDIPH